MVVNCQNTDNKELIIIVKHLFAIIIMAILFIVPVQALRDTKLEEKEPYVGDQFFLSANGSEPTQIAHKDGTIAAAIPGDSVLYIEIIGATRSYELSGYRSFIKWPDEARHFYPPIEYRKMYDADGVTSLGYKFVLAFRFSEFPVSKELTTISGEAKIAKKMGGGARSQPFTVTLRRNTEANVPELYVFDAQDPVFPAHQHLGSVGIQFGVDASLYFDCSEMWDVNLSYSTAPNDFLKEAYTEYELSFLSFTHYPVFNRRFQLIISAKEGSSLYQVIGDSLHPTDAIYNKEIGAFELTGLALGEYVVADEVLPVRKVVRKNNPLNGAIV